MDSSHKRPGSITLLLVGLVLLAAAAGVFCLAPLMTCPECATSRGRLHLLVQREQEEARANRPGKPVLASPVCMRCKDTRKVTLPRKLAYDLRAPQ
jgi:hypothetical protein